MRLPSMAAAEKTMVWKSSCDTACEQEKVNRKGEIVGLLGPNGAGKTTSFYMIVGLIRPLSGHIFLDNEDITKMAMYKRAQLGISYLPQEASVFRDMTVEKNILSILQFSDRSRAEQKERMESLLTEFNLHKVRKNLGKNLSGGERRRTEIARCLAADPKFILLDEPFAGVDPIAVEDIPSVWGFRSSRWTTFRRMFWLIFWRKREKKGKNLNFLSSV